MRPLDAIVCIGRYSPFTAAQRAVVAQALIRAERVIVVVGAARRPRTIAHPFTAAERIEMVAAAFEPADRARIACGAVVDALYNDAQWVRAVQAEVARLAGGATRIGLIAAACHLAKFPQWEAVGTLDESASGILPRYLGTPDDPHARTAIEQAVPLGVGGWLDRFRASEAFAKLVREYAFIGDYKAAWKLAPYPPVYVTVDAAIVHSGHLLLIRRGRDPGQGLWALPGGFLDQEERIFDACIRELREETRLAIPAEVLRGALRESHVFDHPRRSLRGRTITHAFCFVFAGGPLPAVTPDDDADAARWVPLDELVALSELLFDDHYDIATYFLGRI